MRESFERLRREAHFAIRSLRRAPAFVLATSLTLALGIGAVALTFDLLHGTLTRPLPFPEPATLQLVQAVNRETTGRTWTRRWSHPWFARHRERSARSADIAAYGSGEVNLSEYRQLSFPSVMVIARTAVPPAALVPALRAAVAAVNPDLPIHDVQTLEQRTRTAFAARPFQAAFLTAFGLIALALATRGPRRPYSSASCRPARARRCASRCMADEPPGSPRTGSRQ